MVSFKDEAARVLFETGRSKQFGSIARSAVRKLVQLDEGARLEDLRFPPGNRLEALQGDRAGQHSIRINDQFRICFRWTDNGVEDIEIVDYR